MLEKVGQTGAADVLVAGADPIERLDADHRQLGRLEDDQGEAVAEPERLRLGEVERRDGTGDGDEQRRQPERAPTPATRPQPFLFDRAHPHRRLHERVLSG